MTDHRFLQIGPSGSGHTTAPLPPTGWQAPVIVNDSLGEPSPAASEDPNSGWRSLALLERIAAETKHLKAVRDATPRRDAHGRNR